MIQNSFDERNFSPADIRNAALGMNEWGIQNHNIKSLYSEGTTQNLAWQP